MKHIRNLELENAIHENPDDDETWAVYGDWLQSQENPRGEIIALELARQKDPKNQELEALLLAQMEHIREDWMLDLRFEFDEELEQRPLVLRWDPLDPVELEIYWSKGFIFGLNATPIHNKKHKRINWVFDSAFKSFAATFLNYLSVHGKTQKNLDWDFEFHRRSFQAIQEFGPHPHLRTLILGKGNRRSWNYKEDITPLLSLYPGLEQLSLNGNFTISSLPNPNLKSLEINAESLNKGWKKILAGPDLPELEDLSLIIKRLEKPGLWSNDLLAFLNKNSKLKKLETLYLSFRELNANSLKTLGKLDLPALHEYCLNIDNSSGVKSDWEIFRTFYREARLPRLESLRINYEKKEGPCLRELLNSSLLAPLKTLYLYHSDLADKDAQILLDNQDAFKHLEEINLEGTEISHDMKVNLQGTYGKSKIFTD